MFNVSENITKTVDEFDEKQNNKPTYVKAMG